MKSEDRGTTGEPGCVSARSEDRGSTGEPGCVSARSEDREFNNEDLATDETPMQHGKKTRMDALIPRSVRGSSVAKANSKCSLWRDNFRRSLRGMRLGIRGHSSFS